MPTSLCLHIQNWYNVLCSCCKISSMTRLKSNLDYTTLIEMKKIRILQECPYPSKAYIIYEMHKPTWTSFYLEYSCTATVVNTPVSYLTISITRADEIIFIRVEVQWHNRCRMSNKNTYWINTLQNKSHIKLRQHQVQLGVIPTHKHTDRLKGKLKSKRFDYTTNLQGI